MPTEYSIGWLATDHVRATVRRCLRDYGGLPPDAMHRVMVAEIVCNDQVLTALLCGVIERALADIPADVAEASAGLDIPTRSEATATRH